MATISFNERDFVSRFRIDDCFIKTIKIKDILKQNSNEKIIMEFEHPMNVSPNLFNDIFHPIFDEYKFDWVCRIQTNPNYRIYDIINSITDYFANRLLIIRSS